MSHTSTEKSERRSVILGISNKTIPLHTDRITLFVAKGNTEDALKEIREMKSCLAEMERLIAGLERMEGKR